MESTNHLDPMHQIVVLEYIWYTCRSTMPKLYLWIQAIISFRFPPFPPLFSSYLFLPLYFLSPFMSHSVSLITTILLSNIPPFIFNHLLVNEKRRCKDGKHFCKKYKNKGWAFNYLQSEKKLCQEACQCLMLHPYITVSRTIIDILLS